MQFGKFISNLLAAGDVVHMCHLTTRNFAFHMATGTIYPLIRDFADSLCELLMTKTDSLVNFELMMIAPVSNEDLVEYLESLIGNAYEFKKSIEQNEDYSNVVNDVEGFISQLEGEIYKLKFLS